MTQRGTARPPHARPCNRTHFAVLCSTMRIAVFSDIHGNVPAFEAVLADIALQAPDVVVCAGDLVGRGPAGDAIVREVAARGWPTVRGNHEDYLVNFRRQQVPEHWLHTEEWAAARWMAAELSDASADWIASLPVELVLPEAPGVRIIHGTPRSNADGLGPWMDDDTIAGEIASVAEPVLVCAHTHRPMNRRVAGKHVVNVGSVGLPFNNDPRAQYAVLDGDGDRWAATIRAVEYDRGATRSLYARSGFELAGGATSALLLLELEHATPYLVPFIVWARFEGRPPLPQHIPDFLATFTPGTPVEKPDYR